MVGFKTIKVTKTWKDGAWNRLFNGYKKFLNDELVDKTADLLFDSVYGSGMMNGLSQDGSILPNFNVQKVDNKTIALDFGPANNFIEAVEEGTNKEHWVPRVWIENKEWHPHGTRTPLPKRVDGKSSFALITPMPGRHFIAQGVDNARELLPSILDKGFNDKRREAGL
ncbi:MAG: hypothetical protein WC307_06685 [Candidatus Nanoarchaeia archaeon]|jgi:hypothetical protein